MSLFVIGGEITNDFKETILEHTLFKATGFASVSLTLQRHLP